MAEIFLKVTLNTITVSLIKIWVCRLLILFLNYLKSCQKDQTDYKTTFIIADKPVHTVTSMKQLSVILSCHRTFHMNWVSYEYNI